MFALFVAMFVAFAPSAFFALLASSVIELLMPLSMPSKVSVCAMPVRKFTTSFHLLITPSAVSSSVVINLYQL